MTDVSGPRPTIRLDKWLWQARFVKSRSLASGVVSAGKVRVNAQPVSKPARTVGAGDVLTFAMGDDVRVIRIVACGDRRGPSPEARALYDDMQPPAPKTASPRVPGDDGGKPTARDRRNRDAFAARAGRHGLD